MRAVDDRNAWIAHYHQCDTCGNTAGYCHSGLDLIAAIEASMSPEETRSKLLKGKHLSLHARASHLVVI